MPKSDSDELSYGIDRASPGGDYTALTINYKGRSYTYVADEAEAIIALRDAHLSQALADQAKAVEHERFTVKEIVGALGKVLGTKTDRGMVKQIAEDITDELAQLNSKETV